jgi:hypothetical protein
MQEKRNKRLFVSLVLLLVATSVVYLLTSDNNAQNINKDIFKPEDLKSVNRVLLESATGKVELAYNGSRWMVNGKYAAEYAMVDLLFATIEQAEPKREVAGALKDSLNTVLRKEGVHVTLFTEEAKAKDFYAGGNKLKTQTYFVNPVANEVYVMTIPGYRVYVSGILELDENEWRDKRVFAFNWQNFISLEAKFPDKPAENFKISKKNKNFEIEGVAQPDTSKLYTFLDDVSLLSVDQYITSQDVSDSLTKIEPLLIIEVKNLSNKEFFLKLFPPLPNGQIPGILTDSQWVYFNRTKIQPLLRPKSFFISR